MFWTSLAERQNELSFAVVSCVSCSNVDPFSLCSDSFLLLGEFNHLTMLISERTASYPIVEQVENEEKDFKPSPQSDCSSFEIGIDRSMSAELERTKLSPHKQSYFLGQNPCSPIACKAFSPAWLTMFTSYPLEIATRSQERFVILKHWRDIVNFQSEKPRELNTR